VRLGGRLADADGERLSFAPDLAERLVEADRFFDQQLRGRIDTFIERTGMEAPPDDRTAVTAEPEAVTELDLRAAGISTIVWATGYALDYGWIDAPIFDELGYPRHRLGVTDVPGLYFIGLLWQSSLASATLAGPWIDGPTIARELTMAAV
jgi:putative flavoprotein involved in K+ transport